MIPVRPIRTVLAAVDLLSTPEEFVRNAAAFAAASGADLHVLHSYQDSNPVGGRPHDWLETQTEVHRKRIALRNLLDDTLPTGRTVKSARVGIGSPAEAILAAARECEADLIVLGPHRPRQIGDRYLGSTAERVLKEATVPCLILSSPMPLPIQRILIPADFSAPSRSALRCGMGWIRALSGRARVEIDFVHVTGTKSSAGEENPSAMDRKLELEDEVRRITEEAAAKVPIRVHVLEEGDPIDALTRFAARRSTDLLIMGTRGDGVFLRALLGSVSSSMLRRSSIPLLLVPPLAFAESRPDVFAPQRGLEMGPIPL